MSTLKSEKISAQIARMRASIVEHQKAIEQLEDRLLCVLAQEREREHFINSKQIATIVESYSGRKLDMSTIKRWSDSGYLGPVYDERETFPSLDVGSGKQRNVYKRQIALKFLWQRGYVWPQYAVLDAVQLHDAGYPDANLCADATVIRQTIGEAGFQYEVQLDDASQVLTDVPERALSLAPQS